MANNIAITVLKEKERELDSQLSEIRASIGVLLKMDTANASQPQIFISHSTSQPNIKKATPPQTNKKSSAPSPDGSEAINYIADTIRRYNRLVHKAEVKEFDNISNISQILSSAKKKGKRDITNYRPGASLNQTVWGFKEWFDEDGNPKPEFMYDEVFVLSRK